MIDIHLNSYIHAAPDKVFDLMSDHPRFISGGSISVSRIATPGHDEPNGVGCVREIHSLGLKFSEEIVRFERPHRYDYIIRRCNAPMVHDGGTMTFEARGEGTEVNWLTRFKIPVPLLGGGLGRLSKLMLSQEFSRMMMAAKEQLER